MIKKILPIAMVLILLVPFASALRVQVVVKGKMGGNIEYLEMEKEVEGIQSFLLQWYNSESINCDTRIEFRIFKEDVLIKRLWTEKKEMYSGLSDSFEAYWLPKETGNYTVEIVTHNCKEIAKSEKMNFTVNGVLRPEEQIEIEARNIPGEKIEVIVRANRDMKDVVLVPTEYPEGWIFNSEEIGNMKAGEEIRKILDYEYSVQEKNYVTLKAVTIDGEFSSEDKRFEVEKTEDFWDSYGMIVFAAMTIVLCVSIAFNIRFFFQKRGRKYRKL